MSTNTPRLSGCLVILNGFPGVGKLTIARSLQSRLTNVETRFIDNHLIIDPAEAIHPGRGLQHKKFRDTLRHVIFDELKTISAKDAVLIMTCSLGANGEDAVVFAEHLEVGHFVFSRSHVDANLDPPLQIARHRSIPCYVFTLSCGKEQHMSRVQSPDRVLGDKSKLAEPAVLEDLLSNNRILEPYDQPLGHEFGIDLQLQHISLDTTELTPEESALRILDSIALHNSRR